MKVLIIILLSIIGSIGYAECAKKLQVSLPGGSIFKLLDVSPPCIEESDVSPDILLQIRDNRQKTDPSVAKYVYCMFIKLGVGNKKGYLKADKVEQFCKMDGNEELKKVIEECNKRTGKTPTETASNVFGCIQKKMDLKYNF